MPITAGDIRATMTLDASQFTQGVAQARTSLDTITQDGDRINNAFSQIENRLGQSAAQIAAGMESAGQSTSGLLQAVGKAELAAARVDELGMKAQAAAQGLAAAQAAAQQSASALELLQQSAEASAENLELAKQELEELRAAGASTAEAEAEVRALAEETEMLEQAIAEATATHEQNVAAVEKAQVSYQKLSAQLLQAEGAAGKADATLEALTDTLSSADGSSLPGMVDTLSQLGTSTLTSASRSLGSMVANMAGFQSGSAAGTIAAQGFSTVLRTLTRTAGSAQLGLLGLAAGAVFAGAKLYQAYLDAHDSVKNWGQVYEDADASRIVETVTADIELDTSGLAGKVQSAYKEIGDALTDGKPDTAAVIASLQENTTAMFTEVRGKIQEWYDTEMANLDLSTPAGLQRAQQLTMEYNDLMDQVNQLDTNTAGFIASYAGKSTAECVAALSQLESYEQELERLAGRADELTALLQSNQHAAYTTAASGITTDETTVANAIQYVNVEYKMQSDYAREDYEREIGVLWQDYQTALQGAANQQERLEIGLDYAPKFKERNDAYARERARLESDYKTKLANVLQGVATAVSRTDPGMADAIQQAIDGDFTALSQMETNHPALTTAMKGIVEAGLLDGITDVDLTTPQGRMTAMVDLLARGTQESVDKAFGGLTMTDTKGFSGFLKDIGFGSGVELLDSSARVTQFANEVTSAMDQLEQTGDPTRLKNALSEVRSAFDYTTDAGEGGADRIVSYVSDMADLASAAASLGNLDSSALEKYNAGMGDLFTILDAMNAMAAAGDAESIAFLNELSNSLNALGYDTDATNAVATLHEIWNSWQMFDGEAAPEMNLTPDFTVDENYMPSPEELLAMGYGQESVEVEQPIDVNPAPTVSDQYMPSPEELEAIYGPLPSATVDVPTSINMIAEEPPEIGGLNAALTAAGQEAGEGYAGALAEGSGSAASAAQGMASSGASGASAASGQFGSAGSNAGSAFVSGIRGNLGAAAAAGAAIGAAAYSALKSSLSIHSPSKKMRWLGTQTGQGYALGISDEIAASKQSVSRLANETLAAAAQVRNNYNNSLTVNFPGASIAPGTDVRKFSRQLAQYINSANFGVT